MSDLKWRLFMIALTDLFLQLAYLLRFVSRSGELFAFGVIFASDFMLLTLSNSDLFSWSILTFGFIISLGEPAVWQPGNKVFDSCESLCQESMHKD